VIYIPVVVFGIVHLKIVLRKQLPQEREEEQEDEEVDRFLKVKVQQCIHSI
jgi:hypothetical protein